MIIVTGSAGLIGYETVKFFIDKNYHVLGIDNDMRGEFFGVDGSVQPTIDKLKQLSKDQYHHKFLDIRDGEMMDRVFNEYGNEIEMIVHTAAQPSHDWAASDPYTDFSVNATGTLCLLENTRRYCPDATFLHMSTNKVYGDFPNTLSYAEQSTRWIPRDPGYMYGFDEETPIDQCTHSLFGVSKTAGDLLAQEYGRYFGMNTVVFRGGCLTGPAHAGVELHGFLSYLVHCAKESIVYEIFGYKGKQVRDNISSYDVTTAIWEVFQNPKSGEVYNIGGGSESNCSILEAVEMIEEMVGKKIPYVYREEPRKGDHIWWISDTSKFKEHYPNWKITKSVSEIIKEICEK